MWDIARSRRSRDYGEDTVLFAAGAAGGFALGMLLAGRVGGGGVRRAGSAIGDRAKQVADRLRPARLRRATTEQLALTRLEDAVLDSFMADVILRERGVDVGAISRGIIELSGAVLSRDEALHACEVARRVPGVETVVNRMELESGGRAPGTDGWATGEGAEWTGMRSGMGRRRQGVETEPDRPDDSQPMRERALDGADRAQWEDEGHHHRPRMAASAEAAEAGHGAHFGDSELDNQSPFGQRAVPVPEQPQSLNTRARVGEGMKPGTELRLEGSDVPVKPHAHERARGAEEEGGGMR